MSGPGPEHTFMSFMGIMCMLPGPLGLKGIIPGCMPGEGPIMPADWFTGEPPTLLVNCWLICAKDVIGSK